MLVALSIRDVVLIDRLTLSLKPGLSVLTGETGAGKSILLDALGLALGSRADSSLVRPGADQAAVTAEFDVPPAHPAFAVLDEQGLDRDERLVLRRVLSVDGRSRAFINDQPVGVALLRRVGEALVEVHGQFEAQGLLDPQTHRGALDAHGGLADDARRVAAAHRAWREAEAARADALQAVARAGAEEDFLRHAVAELDGLDPKAGEDGGLAERRQLLMNAEKIVEAMNAAHAELAGERGVESRLAAAARHLARVADKAGARLRTPLAAFDRASAEVAEALGLLQEAAAGIELDPTALEQLEERLFALRAAARKHGTDVAGLPPRRAELAARLALIEDQGDALGQLGRAAEAARAGYLKGAEALNTARKAAAGDLDAAVARELAPLKLERACFQTTLARLAEQDWGPGGIDRVTFEVATNPGAPPGPLGRIASGGELARFMLALKVVLAEVGTAATLVFDEVDAGVGGATAAAVGERLARLARDLQVLVVTHSPQVAARGTHHWQVRKAAAGEAVVTAADLVTGSQRREEIARMLSGARITEEARAAAESLIAGRGR